MKTSAIGIVSMVILMFAAGVGLGVAQAEGHTEYPDSTFGDQDAVNAAKRDMDPAGPIGAGELPEGSSAISSHELQEVRDGEDTFYIFRGHQYGPE